MDKAYPYNPQYITVRFSIRLTIHPSNIIDSEKLYKNIDATSEHLFMDR